MKTMCCVDVVVMTISAISKQSRNDIYREKQNGVSDSASDWLSATTPNLQWFELSVTIADDFALLSQFI